MNQILDYNPNKGSSGGPADSDKIVRVFAIILIVFALCFLTMGIWQYLENSKDSTNVAASANAKEASITTEIGEKVVKVTVEHDKAIEKMIYKWNNDKETTIKGKGESTMVTDIPLLAGENRLSIKVVDIEGVETTYEEDITSETGEDKVYPNIDLGVSGNEVIVQATDETKIAYITYRWNDGDEIKIDDIEEDGKTINCKIEIPKGENDLMVIAVDANNNTTNQTRKYKGVLKPEVNITIAADKKSADIICYHENGLTKVTVTRNGQEEVVELDNKQEFSFRLDMVEESTELTIKAESVDLTETTVTENIVQDPEPVEEKLEVSITEEDGLAKIQVESSAGLKKVKVNVNDVDYDEYIQLDEGQNDFQFGINLQEGNNKITIVAIDVNDKEQQEVKEIAH